MSLSGHIHEFASKGDNAMNLIQFLTPKCDVAVVYDYNTIRRSLEKFRAHGYTAIPVVTKDGDYVGCVSEGDFLWQLAQVQDGVPLESIEKKCVREIIRKDFNPPMKISTSLDSLVEQIINQNFVPMVDDRNKFIGIITRKDIIKYLFEKRA